MQRQLSRKHRDEERGDTAREHTQRLNRQGEAQQRERLLKLLAGHFEVLVAIPVLEEALGIKSLFPDNFCETAKDPLN